MTDTEKLELLDRLLRLNTELLDINRRIGKTYTEPRHDACMAIQGNLLGACERLLDTIPLLRAF